MKRIIILLFLLCSCVKVEPLEEPQIKWEIEYSMPYENIQNFVFVGDNTAYYDTLNTNKFSILIVYSSKIKPNVVLYEKQKIK